MVLGDFLNGLRHLNFSVAVGVPCSKLGQLIDSTKNHPGLDHIIAAGEGEAIAMAAGVHLTGKRAVVFAQNSGLGNMVNPISSLLHPFRIPVLIVLSLRGIKEAPGEDQHAFMGGVTPSLLKIMDVAVAPFPQVKSEVKKSLEFIAQAFSRGQSCCLTVSGTTLSINNQAMDQEKPIDKAPASPATIRDLRAFNTKVLHRADILDQIKQVISKNTAIIASTGKCSRELYTRDSSQHFYMVGSMGCAAALGHGVALAYPHPVLVIDGDGSLLMRLGNLATIGRYAPKNLIHVLINNQVHDSTGGQQTAAKNVDFCALAANCGYKTVIKTSGAVKEALNLVQDQRGPSFIEVCSIPGSPQPLGRVAGPLEDLAQRFSTFLKSNS